MKEALIYLGITLALAFVSAPAYVIVMTLTLPKSDLAFGQWPFQDPLVFPILAMVAGASGLLAWPLFAFLGRHSPPATVAKITGVTTLFFILVATPFEPRIAFVGSYVVCLGTLFYCYLRHRTGRGQHSLQPTRNPRG
jgi:hypothetical protein